MKLSTKKIPILYLDSIRKDIELNSHNVNTIRLLRQTKILRRLLRITLCTTPVAAVTRKTCNVATLSFSCSRSQRVIDCQQPSSSSSSSSSSSGSGEKKRYIRRRGRTRAKRGGGGGGEESDAERPTPPWWSAARTMCPTSTTSWAAWSTPRPASACTTTGANSARGHFFLFFVETTINLVVVQIVLGEDFFH